MSSARPDPADARFEAVMAKVRKILAKAERTDVPAEAETFLAKAQELMAAWSIDEAMLAAGEGRPAVQVVARSFPLRAPFAARRAVLAHAVTVANRCQGLRVPDESAPSGWAWVVVGLEHDAEWCHTLHRSLDDQLERALRAARERRPPGESPKAYANAFVSEFCRTVARRLHEATAAAEAAAEGAAGDAAGNQGSVALVLAAKEEAAGAELRRRYPRVRSVRLSATTSARGRRAGRQAGELATIARGAAGPAGAPPALPGR